MRNKIANTIWVKAMCIIVHDGNMLTGKGYDSVKDEHFFRVLGGSIHFCETAEEGVRREMREEFGCEMKELQYIEVVENIFIYEEKKGREVIFLFKGALADTGIYKKDVMHIVEDA